MIGTTWCATRGGGGVERGILHINKALSCLVYNGLYGKAPPKRVQERAGISQVEAYERADSRSLWL